MLSAARHLIFCTAILSKRTCQDLRSTWMLKGETGTTNTQLRGLTDTTNITNMLNTSASMLSLLRVAKLPDLLERPEGRTFRLPSRPEHSLLGRSWAADHSVLHYFSTPSA